MQTIIYILPELFLSLSIMTLLIVGVFVKKSFKIINSLTILCLIFAVAVVLNQPQETTKIFNERIWYRLATILDHWDNYIF